MNGPVFIVGCPRSGTTLIRGLLGSHPNLTFPPESHFITQFYRAYGNPRNSHQATVLARRILRMRTVKSWGLDIPEDSFDDCRSYAQLVTRLYDTWARREGKTRWGDKTPQNLIDIPLLIELFPNAQIVHVYRDGRDVALSWLEAQFSGDLYTAAVFWRSSVMKARRDGERLPRSTYLELRYEDLTTATRAIMEKTCAFLGEPFTEAVLKPTLLHPHRLTTAPWLNARSFVADDRVVGGNFEKWRKALSMSDRLLFESIAGDLLKDLGYDVNGERRAVCLLERAYWRFHNLFWYVNSRLPGLTRPHILLTFLELRRATAWAWVREQLRVGSKR
jgi:hypothetical protein